MSSRILAKRKGTGHDDNAVERNKLSKPSFGVSITPYADNIDRLINLARLIDDLKVDLIGIQDHPYNGSFAESWTLLTALATSTKRVRFFPNVVDLPTRLPAMVAKAAATLDIITQGRTELGVGAGAFWEAIASYGGPVRVPAEAVDALDEGIRIIRLIWDLERSGRQRATLNGKYYRLENAQTGPRPPHHIGIWVGALGPRMLRLVGSSADGWSIPLQTYFPDSRLREAQRVIDQAAVKSRRSPDSIRRIRNLMGIIDEEGRMESSMDAEGEVVVGTSKQWVNKLTSYYQDLGLNSFIFWPETEPADEENQMRLFAERVIPAVGEKTSAQ